MKTRPLSRAGKVLVPLMFYDMSLIKPTIFEIHTRVKCVNRNSETQEFCEHNIARREGLNF